eukprot:6252233-Prymnesium_polylepis.1
MAHGTWHMAHGTWHMARATQYTAHGTCDKPAPLTSCSLIASYSSRASAFLACPGSCRTHARRATLRATQPSGTLQASLSLSLTSTRTAHLEQARQRDERLLEVALARLRACEPIARLRVVGRALEDELARGLRSEGVVKLDRGRRHVE